MSDAITKLSPHDLDRLAAEVLGFQKRDIVDVPYCVAVKWYVQPRGRFWVPLVEAANWHPTQSHDQCQLLVDAVKERGLQHAWVEALKRITLAPRGHWDFDILNDTECAFRLATAPPLAKTQAAVAVLRKGE